MLRIALIGAGRTVHVGHAPALTAMSDHYQVVAIADRAPEALERVGIQLAVPPEHRYSDYRTMLLEESVDVVAISLPHAYHHEAVQAAVLAGAHVITERPLALSLRDAEDTLRLAEMRGKLVSVLHYLCFYPPFQAGLQLIREGAIGIPFFIRCEGVTGGFGAGTATYHPEWHNDPEIAGGGVWLDSGYHNAYLCAAMMGSPVMSIMARMGTFAQDLHVEDTAAALLTHENGGISSVQVAWSVPSGGQRVFEVYGTEGTISFDHEGYLLGVFSNNTQTWQHPAIEANHVESFIGFYRALAECLQYGAPPPVSHREALHALEIAIGGYQSQERGEVERMSHRHER